VTVACIPAEEDLSIHEDIIAKPVSFPHCPTTPENAKAAAEAFSDPLCFDASWGIINPCPPVTIEAQRQLALMMADDEWMWV
jgi:hypothetical protein